MKKLTKAQTTALQTIADNPGKVANNWSHADDELLYIRSTTARVLVKAGLIESVQTARTMSYTYPSGHTVSVELIVWALTDAGREYLGR